MCETVNEPRETFDKRKAHWEIIRGTKTRVVTRMGNQTAEYCETLEEAAELMSATVKRTILAMPKNDATVITLDCCWS